MPCLKEYVWLSGKFRQPILCQEESGMNKKLVRTLLRVSSRQQLHGDDIPLQRAETKNFIEQHSEWAFDREYIEKAV